jgi:hypothetical protein
MAFLFSAWVFQARNSSAVEHIHFAVKFSEGFVLTSQFIVSKISFFIYGVILKDLLNSELKIQVKPYRQWSEP